MGENGGGDVLGGSRPGGHGQRGDGTVVGFAFTSEASQRPIGVCGEQRAMSLGCCTAHEFVVRGVNVDNGMADKQVAHGVGGRRSPT